MPSTWLRSEVEDLSLRLVARGHAPSQRQVRLADASSVVKQPFAPVASVTPKPDHLRKPPQPESMVCGDVIGKSVLPFVSDSVETPGPETDEQMVQPSIPTTPPTSAATSESTAVHYQDQPLNAMIARTRPPASGLNPAPVRDAACSDPSSGTTLHVPPPPTTIAAPPIAAPESHPAAGILPPPEVDVPLAIAASAPTAPIAPAPAVSLPQAPEPASAHKSKDLPSLDAPPSSSQPGSPRRSFLGGITSVVSPATCSVSLCI